MYFQIPISLKVFIALYIVTHIGEGSFACTPITIGDNGPGCIWGGLKIGIHIRQGTVFPTFQANESQ